MKQGRKILLVAFILAICITYVNLNSTEVLSRQTDPNHSIRSTDTDYPRLFITKVVDRSEIVIGKTFTVTITIYNFGNETAYNVTFIDQITNPWIFNISGLTQLSYGQINPNETRQFSYLVQVNLVGKYTLYSARVEYYSSELETSKFQSYSNEVEIEVVEPPTDFSLSNYNVIITFLLILLVLDSLLIIRLIAPILNRRLKQE